MFRSARIKLTAWYVFIIMLISTFFSVAIYRVLTFELNRIERIQRLRIERRSPPPFFLDHKLIIETKNRLKVILTLINLVILGASAGAGYFLAGKTLKPIKQMVDEQGRFITDASHELRTPLTSLKSEIEVNLRDKKLTLNQAKKLLKSNLEEVNNLQLLSDKLIRLVQYQEEGNGLKMSDVSLPSLINEAIKKVANLAKIKNIKIVSKINDYLFEGNKEALIEMLVIFLDNAIKYSPEKTRINLKTEKTNNCLLIQIADEGVGIEKKDIPHLFDRFYRADKSRGKTDVLGYGLGLSIAKQIIEQHHGTIKVKSQVGKGSVFSILLPIKH